ncbi:MAG: tetratricopeptide repeat protein [Nitrospirae bacterium]|nr:tetratricopeptide repeat protein [Nitrospirota bacterium]
MDDDLEKKRALELWNEGLRAQMEGNIEKAIELYTRSIEIHATAEAYTFRGWAYSFQNRVDEAIEECKRAIEVDPTFGNPYNDIGSYLVHKGKNDEAIEWFEKAKLAPRYDPKHFPYMNLGRLFAAKGMILRAIKEFEEALKIQPREPTCMKALRELKAGLN